MSDIQRDLKWDKVIDSSNCALKREVYDEHNPLKEAADVLAPEKPSETCPSSLANEEELEFNDPKSYSLQSRDRGEALQERSLHLGEEDWAPLERSTNHRGGAESGRSFHSPSGSDNSSCLSNSELSSLSSKSEASSFARELSPSIYLHSSLDSIHVSPFTSSSISQSFSQANGVRKQAISTDAFGHGAEEVSKTHPQIKTDDESQLYEYLEKVLKGNMGESECSDGRGVKESMSLSLGKEDSPSIIGTVKYCRSSWTGGNIGKEGAEPQDELGSSSSLEHSEKQWVTSLATAGFFSTRCLSAEIYSDTSQNTEDVVTQFTTIKPGCLGVIESSQAQSFECDVNIQVDDSYDNLSSTNADGRYIQAGEPAFQVKSIDSVLVASMQKGSLDISMPLGDSLTPIHPDDNTTVGGLSLVSREDTQKRLSSNSLNFIAYGQISSDQELALHPESCSNEMTILTSQPALQDELQCDKKVVNIPAKSIAASIGQLSHETLHTEGSLKCNRKTHKNRRGESFSLNSCSDPTIQNTECSFIMDGCNVYGKARVSPIRKWVSLGAKSRAAHLADVSSHAYLGNPVFNNLGKGAGMEKVERKSLECAFPGVIHASSKKLSKGLMPSENQLFVVSEHGISHKPHFHATKRTDKPVGPKHEHSLGRLSVSTPETKDTHPSASASPAQLQILEGLLHRGCKNGLPYYTFSLNEADDVMIAKKWKIDNCGRDGFDWVYTFHSGRDNHKKRSESAQVARVEKDDHASGLLGQMKVSSSLCPEFNSSGSLEHSVETEFVLFDVNREHAKESPAIQRDFMENAHCLDQFTPSRISSPNGTFYASLSTSITSSTSMPGYSTSSLIPRHVAVPKHISKKKVMPELRLSYSSKQGFSESCQSSPMKFTSVDGSAICLSNHLCSHLELAAIVTRVPLSEQKSMKSRLEDAISKDIGGWGLKFLEKSSDGSRAKNILDWQVKSPASETVENIQLHSDKTGYSDVPVMSSTQHATSCTFDNCSLGGSNISCRKQSQTSVTIIVPADVHGLPTIKSSRPSPLIQRWKLGGKCDCGGWDLGCTLTIFNGQTQNRSDFIEGNTKAEDFHLLDVFIQGKRTDTPMLTMAAVHGDLYSLSFQSQLSALQAFSIGVAILHGRDPFMHTKLESHAVESCSRSLDFPFAKQGRALSQMTSAPNEPIEVILNGICEGFSMSYLSDPPLSPFGRV